MSLTPEDIEHQVFKEKFRGYDPEEVDRFLDRVSDRLVELQRERDEVAEELRALQRSAAESIEAEQLLKRTLIAAQRAADQTVAEARAEAEQTVNGARQEAEQLLAQARGEAERMVADARQRADDLLAEARLLARRDRESARGAVERVRGAVDELRRFRGEYRDRVRGVIADQLAVLDRFGELPDVPPEILALADLEVEPAPVAVPGRNGEDWEARAGEA